MDVRRPPLRFGVFEVDVAAGELRKQGLKVKLQEQPFQVLVALIEHPREVVTREDLHKLLWSADTNVDFERGLNRAVNRLRDPSGAKRVRRLSVVTNAAPVASAAIE